MPVYQPRLPGMYSTYMPEASSLNYSLAGATAPSNYGLGMDYGAGAAPSKYGLGMDYGAGASPTGFGLGDGVGGKSATAGWGALSKFNPWVMGGMALMSAIDQAHQGRIADWSNKANADLQETAYARGGEAVNKMQAPYLPIANPPAAALQAYAAMKNDEKSVEEQELMKRLAESEIAVNQAKADSTWGRLAAPADAVPAPEAPPTAMPSLTDIPGKKVKIIPPPDSATITVIQDGEPMVPAKPAIAPKPKAKTSSKWGRLTLPPPKPSSKIPDYLLPADQYDRKNPAQKGFVLPKF